MNTTKLNKSILIVPCLLTSMVTTVFVSTNAIAMPATVQYQMGQTNTSMNSPHQGMGTSKPQPFWSKEQAKAEAYEKKLLEQIKNNPDNKSSYSNLANLYLSHNKTRKAIGAYQEAINHDANNAKLFAGLSIAYLHQSKYAMAKAMAEQAIKLDPEMKHAMKIKEYIQAKEEVIEQASKVSTSSVAPDDATHSPVKHGTVKHGSANPSTTDHSTATH